MTLGVVAAVAAAIAIALWQARSRRKASREDEATLPAAKDGVAEATARCVLCDAPLPGIQEIAGQGAAREPRDPRGSRDVQGPIPGPRARQTAP